ncbi:hypothetical protein [Couchioplanes azureus]|uniref:hypothetical protein n=1 Tax=Couchioplanes caeruleus TaxID=56438 RepID=UPI0016712A33|nr:hypothetical protein [Couchioplanes caeruleus]GGQ70457.1 hypothetical protein GCM10010166_45490 [Couchioplanes caeruleus subsp. azureus]
MTASTCGAESIVRRGGPVQIPLQPCCMVALLRAARTPQPPTTMPCPLHADLRALTAAAVTAGAGVGAREEIR